MTNKTGNGYICTYDGQDRNSNGKSGVFDDDDDDDDELNKVCPSNFDNDRHPKMEL